MVRGRRRGAAAELKGASSPAHETKAEADVPPPSSWKRLPSRRYFVALEPVLGVVLELLVEPVLGAVVELPLLGVLEPLLELLLGVMSDGVTSIDSTSVSSPDPAKLART